MVGNFYTITVVHSLQEDVSRFIETTELSIRTEVKEGSRHSSPESPSISN